jgi:hypothetical protein
MSKGRLTRQELSWLLTQEAQNAAERLRSGVQILRTQAPPPPDASGDELAGGAQDPAKHVDASLDALDDVMKMLSNLNQRSSASMAAAASAPRRGRIDVAALLVEIAPDARVSIEPGSGTEVYGDEADFRRMFQVLVGHGSGEGSSVNVRRDGDLVKVSVLLGPDSSPTAETERAWLSRMAMRYGGRHELEGGNEVVSFPAEGSQERSEREALQRELDEVRKQGEVYARELAAVFERGEEVATTSTYPPAPAARPGEHFATITKVCAGVAAELRATLLPAAKELATMRASEVTDEQLERLRRRMAHARDVVASVESVGSVPAAELAVEVDLAELARGAARECARFADRAEVKIDVKAAGDGAARAYVRLTPKVAGALARELVAHAVQASPRGSTVGVTVVTGDPGGGPRLLVDDAGSPLPASARRAFLALETHAGAYGRPSGLPIFMAAELASCLGARLELSDSPAGGLRAAVTFSKS